MSTIKQLAPMRRLCFHHLLAVSVLLLAAALVQECTAQGGSSGGDHAPLVSPLAKDPATSLYTISIKDGSGPLVVDLAGPLVWSTCACASGHPTFPCRSAECDAANGFNWSQQGRQWQQGYDAGADGGDHYCTCTARPCDPVTRARCAAGDLTTFAMSANATDGRNALYPVSFQAVGACAPDWLLRSSSLPAGAAGVAGFGRAPLSLPSQLAVRRGFGRRFALCLPGVAIFGDTPIFLGSYPPDLITTIASTPLAANPRSGGYYLPVEAISVSWPNWNLARTRAALPPGALELDATTGRGGVTLSTVQRYTAMRSDVYRAFVQAFSETIGKPGFVKPMPAVPPFELCYDTFSLRHVRVLGWDVPLIRLELGAGASMNWTVDSGNSMVQAADRTLCLAVVEMAPEAEHAAAAPAVVIGGYQVEDNLLVFDEDTEVLQFSGLLWGSGATCSGFNFNAPQ